MEEDTPRSVGFGSPRDDRFYTPRTIARSNSNSNSEEWQTPRYETPRYGSDGEYQTPRMYDADKKQGSIRNINSYENQSKQFGSTRNNSNDYYNSPRYNDPYNYQAQAKNDDPYRNQQQRSNSQAQSKASYYQSNNSNNAMYQNNNQYSQYGQYEEQGYAKNTPIEEENEEDYLTHLSAAGVTEKDVEDIFSYARHGRCEEIEKLLTRGIPVDVRDEFGNTILIIACQNGNKRVAKAVLRRGANINARNHKGNTPLHYCYHYGYGETLGQYMIEKGAHADAKNNMGKITWQGI